MILNKVTLNEEIDRMKVLAGVPVEQSVLEEGFLSNIAGLLGITLASFTGALSQTVNLEKLNYSPERIEMLKNAMTSPVVIEKLHELGVDDNNINKQVKALEDKKVVRYYDKTAHSEKELAGFIKNGYHLTAIETDTVIKIQKESSPNNTVEGIMLSMDEGKMFESGRFALSEADMHNIKAVLDSIKKDNSILVNVTIKSSTDKQGITPSLQKTLQHLGYEPNNKGLSTARNDGVSSLIALLGVSSDIISKQVVFEQGGPVIDDSARYVFVLFDVTKQILPHIKPSSDTTVTNTYTLFKGIATTGGKIKKRWPSFRLFKTNIRHYNKKSTPNDCFFLMK